MPPRQQPRRSRAPRRPVITNADKVRVVTRVRPLRSDEAAGTPAAPELKVDAVGNTVEDILFDRVFDQRTATAAVFDAEVLPIVDSWLEGFNACVFAYGQTGSGKTHTMLGADGGKKELDGVIPLTVAYALRRLEEEQATAALLDPNVPSAHRVRVTYAELYNNEFRDLLKGYTSAQGVPPLVGVESTTAIGVREDSLGRVFLDGASEFTIRSATDVLALVKYGAVRRATDRTDMNAHSSRSHAILTLHHQHRWKLPDGTMKQAQSSLHLVDLAGSEYAKRTGNQGDKLKESIAINSGLFALGNVIAALAGNQGRRVGNHIPYRDSLLTRVLQSALGGDSLTLMIVCCSPAPDDVSESLGSLRYAECARKIQAGAQLHVEDFVPEASPMDGDLADPDESLNRRCLWLEVPGYGDVYSRVVGSPGEGELILFVHGSGPTNSSTWWSSIIWDMYVRRLPKKPYFMVAIDCPGYGRSPGDRQTIRSEPGSFLAAVVASLGYNDALCLVGSSQGACAVFNALLERPTLSRHVAVMDPVGHDVFRYKLIKQPALLVFDTEDDGHPVKVGRWMRDNLPRCTYFEFASSKEPYWHADHMGSELLKLVESQAPARRALATKVSMASAIAGAETALVRLAGGLVNWADSKGYGEPIKPIAAGLLAVPSMATLGLELLNRADDGGEDGDAPAAVADDLRFIDRQSTIISTESCDVEGAEWEPDMDPKTRRVFYTNTATLEVMWRRPRHGTVVEAAPVQGQAAAATAAPTAAGSALLFEDEAPQPEEAPPLTEADLARLEEARVREEGATTDCMKCGEVLTLKPKRFAKCRHVVCELCFAQSSLWTGCCCVCFDSLASAPKTKEPMVPAEDRGMQMLIEALTSDPRLNARVDAVAAALVRRSAMHQVVLEYGNTASGSTGSAYTVEAYCRVLKTVRGKSASVALPSTIACVAFNINPDFPKAAVRVTTSPFVLQRTMALCFTCEMTVTFTNGPAGMPPIVLPYEIRHEPVTARRVVIYVGSVDMDPSGGEQAKRRNAKPAPCVVDVENTIEAFVYV